MSIFTLHFEFFFQEFLNKIYNRKVLFCKNKSFILCFKNRLNNRSKTKQD